MNIRTSQFSSRITAAAAALVAVALTSILIASGIRGDLPTVAGLDHSQVDDRDAAGVVVRA